MTSREIRRVQDHVLLLIQSAQERVAGFLLEMANRATVGNAVELSMSRQDIADYSVSDRDCLTHAYGVGEVSSDELRHRVGLCCAIVLRSAV